MRKQYPVWQCPLMICKSFAYRHQKHNKPIQTCSLRMCVYFQNKTPQPFAALLPLRSRTQQTVLEHTNKSPSCCFHTNVNLLNWFHDQSHYPVLKHITLHHNTSNRMKIHLQILTLQGFNQQCKNNHCLSICPSWWQNLSCCNLYVRHDTPITQCHIWSER